MKITIAQLNSHVGSIDSNLEKITKVLRQSAGDSTDLVISSELFLVGYPPKDLLERNWFIEKAGKAVQNLCKISEEYPQTGIICGVPLPVQEDMGKDLYNSAVLVYRGKVVFTQHKSLLPTYDVFDEHRYFEPAPEVHTVNFKGKKLGVSICEDAWSDFKIGPGKKMYKFDPIKELVKKGAELLVNISASPFYMGKEEVRYRLISNHARKHKVPFVFVNQVGGNDELVFDGRSMCFDGEGKPIVICPSFTEDVRTIDMSLLGDPGLFAFQDKIESVYEALVLGIRDYFQKTGYCKAVVGLSGGIDSAVTCCLAENALGKENVLGVTMPSPYSSRGSVEDSRILAFNLGINFKTVPISEIYYAYLEALKNHFEGMPEDVSEENIQSRIRGNILMAFSNKLGHLVLSTGNKSELSVGYCTLYGDMSGGLSVLSDVPKTIVYRLASFINREREIIPGETIKKPPSAELKPDQIDEDSLPAYEVLDQILNYYVEEGYSVKDLIKSNYDSETVLWVVSAVDKNEYKRKQSAPGLKVTTKAFGVGRRMPIAAKHYFKK